MKKSQRLFIIISVILIVIGSIIFVGAMAVLDFDFRRLSTEKYQTNNYKISDSFDNISIDVSTANVTFEVSPDNSCDVVCYEQEKVRHTATVEDETLLIKVEDTRKWYEHIGINLENASITVYLPEREYISLSVTGDTSDINIPKAFSFNKASVETDTGDINLNGASFGELRLETDTGDINVTSANITSLVQIESDTGDVELKEVKTDKFDIKNNTGIIRLADSVATYSIFVENDTGDVVFKKADAASIFVETATGDVRGSLLSEKLFVTKTSTGDVSVPNTVSGGKCEIITNTGDIKLTVN